MATVVLGLFDVRAQAERAQSAIEGIGIPISRMSLTEQNGSTGIVNGSTESAGDDDTNWWERLKTMLGFGVHEEDMPYYNEGLRRGGTLLTVQTDANREQEVSGIMADHDAVDIDSRAKEWRSSGWNPEQIAIPVVEEELKVGKRTVQRGGVRIYTSITDTPVEESVTLREEHVEVTRRPMDRAAQASDFVTSDTPIEIIETAEEPVISKKSRVVEEVVIDKGATERTETVRDTVRRQDVDVKKAS